MSNISQTRNDVLSLDDIAAKIGPIARRYGVPKVYLYGSYARGEADAESDIDLCIERGRIGDYFELGHFEMDLENILGKRVDVTTTGASKQFIDSIRKDMMLIYEERWGWRCHTPPYLGRIGPVRAF